MNFDNAGVIYVASGSQFVKEATQSALSLRRAMPDIPVALFTDQTDVTSGPWDQVLQLSNPEHNFADRIRCFMKTPFQRTIALDTDTFVAAPFWELFEILEEFDWLGCHVTARASSAPSNPYNYQCMRNEAGNFMGHFLLNGGVLGFSTNTAATNLIESWLREHRRDLETNPQAVDQNALCRVLSSSDIRLAIVPSEYNFRIPFCTSASGEVKIIHGRPSHFRAFARDFEAFAKLLNQDICCRTFSPYLGITHASPKRFSILQLLQFVRFGGLRATWHYYRPRLLRR